MSLNLQGEDGFAVAKGSVSVTIVKMLNPKMKYAADVILWSIAAPLALFARVEFDSWNYARSVIIYVLITLIVKAYLIYRANLHHQRWRVVSVHDLEALLKTIGLGTGLFFVMQLIIFPIVNLPRSIPLIEGVIAVILLGGIRLANRLLHEGNARRTFDAPRKRVLIIGAGETGVTLAREMFRHPESGLDPIGFLDDDPRKRMDRFGGLPIFGSIDDLHKTVAELNVTQVLIAMPTAGGKIVRKVVELATSARVPYRIVPAYHEVFTGKVSISQIREVEVEDLLKREPIVLNIDDISSFLAGKIVLVTGAGGSIGSEIVRQIARFNPKELVLLDHFETGLYYLEREIESMHPQLRYHSVIANIQNREKLDKVFKQFSPQIVFHAAAHKHVPLMENNPDEAVLNNVLGTENLVGAAIAHNIERFVNISTDKAVKPTSVMGACKRLSEILVTDAGLSTPSSQIYVSVRFGNVLGSQGSVIPVFKEQIRRGGPVTVTHPDMTRYFMTIPEAAQLVLQAASLGQNGAVYVLEMGEPVKIVDLARDLIQLSGFVPGQDVEIVFTGMRPGEKLQEQLLTDQEDLEASKYEGIMVAGQNGSLRADLHGFLFDLYEGARERDHEKIRKILKELVPTYVGNGTGHKY